MEDEKPELGEVLKLTLQLQEAEAELEKAEEAFKKAKGRVLFLSREAIPSAMEELGYKKVELGDGTKISVSEEVFYTIPDGKKDEVHQWLEDHQFGGLIKANVEMSFGKDEEGKRIAAIKALEAIGAQFSVDKSVHPMTMKAFIKEQLQEGSEVPMDLFGAQCVSVAKVSIPKRTKFKL